MSLFARSAVVGVLIIAATPTLADVKAGVDAYQRGDYAAAVREWRPLADRGDPDAQFNLAQAYKLGRGVPADLDTAIGLYRRAAVQNHPEAEALLGLLLFQNGKRAEAMPWLGKAADRGDAASQYVYGTALFNGDMVAQDWPRAYALMTRASAQGLPPARQALLEMDKHMPLAQRQQGAAMARGPVTSGTKVAARSPVVQLPAMARSPVRAASAPAAASPARIFGWKVQLGAFGKPAGANALFASLKSRVGALSDAQPILIPSGAVTRLQAGPFPSRAAAQAACAAVKARAGQACFPVAP